MQRDWWKGLGRKGYRDEWEMHFYSRASNVRAFVKIVKITSRRGRYSSAPKIAQLFSWWSSGTFPSFEWDLGVERVVGRVPDFPLNLSLKPLAVNYDVMALWSREDRGSPLSTTRGTLNNVAWLRYFEPFRTIHACLIHPSPKQIVEILLWQREAKVKIKEERKKIRGASFVDQLAARRNRVKSKGWERPDTRVTDTQGPGGDGVGKKKKREKTRGRLA